MLVILLLMPCAWKNRDGLIPAHLQRVMKFLMGPTLTKTDLRPTPAPSPKLGVFAGKCAVLRRSISESCLFFMAESLPGLFGNVSYKKHKKCDDILTFD